MTKYSFITFLQKETQYIGYVYWSIYKLNTHFTVFAGYQHCLYDNFLFGTLHILETRKTNHLHNHLFFKIYLQAKYLKYQKPVKPAKHKFHDIYEFSRKWIRKDVRCVAIKTGKRFCGENVSSSTYIKLPCTNCSI